MDSIDQLEQELAEVKKTVSKIEKELKLLRATEHPIQTGPTCTPEGTEIPEIQEDKQKSPQKARKEWEIVFGENVMGMAAALLILFGVTMFAVLLFPNLTDNLKIAGMFLTSGIVFGIGVKRLDRERFFPLLLSSLGAGMMYLSLFLTALYFKKISELVLFFLLAVWSVVVSLLGKQKNSWFYCIGELGIVVAVIFGCRYSYLTHSDTRMLLVITYFTILSIFFHFLFYSSKEKNGWIQKSVIYMAEAGNLFVLSTMSTDLFSHGSGSAVYAALLLTTVTGFMMIFLYRECQERSRFWLCETGTGIGVLSLTGPLVLISKWSWMVILTDLVLFVCIFYAAEYGWKTTEQKTGKYFLQAAAILQLMFGMDHACGLLDGGWKFLAWLLLFCVTICLLIWGKHREEIPILFIASLLFPFYPVFLYNNMPDPWKILIGLGLCMGAIMHFVFAEKANPWYRLYAHIAGQLAVFRGMVIIDNNICSYIWSRDTEPPLTLWGIRSFNWSTMIQVLMMVLLVSIQIHAEVRNRTGDPEKKPVRILLFGQRTVLLAGASVLLYETADMDISILLKGFLYILLLLAAIALTIEDERANRKKHPLWGCLKTTWFLFVVFGSLSVVSYLISMMLLVLAMSFIYYGFQKEIPVVRKYGLVLSMLTVLKLLFFDIEYTGTGMRAVAFILGGVVCLGISGLYNHMKRS